MNNRKIQDLINATAFDKNGDKLGSVKEVFINDATGQPDFVEVGHGLFGMSSSLVPLRGHRLNGEELQLAFSKDRIQDAPNIDNDAQLTEDDQNTIYRHFEVDSVENTEKYEPDHDEYSGRAPYGNEVNTGVDTERKNGFDELAQQNAGAGAAAGAGAGAAGYDKEDIDGTHGNLGANNHNGEDTDHRDRNGRDARFTDPDAKFQNGDRDRLSNEDTMVRSEERLNVDKERVETGTARLRKYVVKDTETVEVPVEREELRVERTPIDGERAAGAAGAAGAGIGNDRLGEDEASVTLHEERVNVEKKTVPVEEVSLGKETVRDTKTVREDVGHEEIEVDRGDKGLRDGDIDGRDADNLRDGRA